MNYTPIIITFAIIVFFAYTYLKIQKLKRLPMAKDHEKLVTLTTQNFENQIKTGLTLVDFLGSMVYAL